MITNEDQSSKKRYWNCFKLFILRNKTYKLHIIRLIEMLDYVKIKRNIFWIKTKNINILSDNSIIWLAVDFFLCEQLLTKSGP